MRITFLLLFAFFIQVSYATDNDRGLFLEESFEEAKVLAGEEGKLFFVEFFADWCVPCKWMEETTYKDTEVVQLLKENYIAVKLNIDEISGYDLKQHYSVNILPTILIFNSQGVLIERMEETMSPRKMAYVLNYHNSEENKAIVKHEVNKSPSDILNSTLSEANQINNINSISDSEKRADIFRIQLGVFNKYENTRELVESLQSQFMDPVTVINDIKDGKAIYRVMMGEFETKSDASHYLAVLMEEYEMKGIVK